MCEDVSDLGLVSRRHRGHHAAEAPFVGGEQDAPYEGVDGGTTRYLVAPQVSIRGGERRQVGADDEHHRDRVERLGEAVGLRQRDRLVAVARRAARDRRHWRGGRTARRRRPRGRRSRATRRDRGRAGRCDGCDPSPRSRATPGGCRPTVRSERRRGSGTGPRQSPAAEVKARTEAVVRRASPSSITTHLEPRQATAPASRRSKRASAIRSTTTTKAERINVAVHAPKEFDGAEGENID